MRRMRQNRAAPRSFPGFRPDQSPEQRGPRPIRRKAQFSMFRQCQRRFLAPRPWVRRARPPPVTGFGKRGGKGAILGGRRRAGQGGPCDRTDPIQRRGRRIRQGTCGRTGNVVPRRQRGKRLCPGRWQGGGVGCSPRNGILRRGHNSQPEGEGKATRPFAALRQIGRCVGDGQRQVVTSSIRCTLSFGLRPDRTTFRCSFRPRRGLVARDLTRDQGHVRRRFILARFRKHGIEIRALVRPGHPSLGGG